MKFVFVQNKTRGTRILIDKKHVKTIPNNLVKAINYYTIERLMYSSKRLSYGERLYLTNYAAYENWKEKLAKNEKHLFELIKNAIPVLKNRVHTHSGKRLELVLDNKTKITVPEKVYNSLLLTEKTIHSNF